MQRDHAVLVDIVLACRDIADFIGGINEAEFSTNSLVQSAVLRQLEIIGEASKRLSSEFRDKHSEIQWKKMAGLRDRLIHAYDDIDSSRIWKIASVDVPYVLAKIEPLLPEEDDTPGS